MSDSEDKNIIATTRLQAINSPADLRKLPEKELPALCDDLRQYIIKNLSMNPGHFASSMGAVEITVALHYVFDTPHDRIVWDVGHQAYAHKILTGRRDLFPKQRTLGGISGFPNPKESEYDTFMAGHASNSISAALGMAIADQNTPGMENRKTVAVIGDASISGGLAFEGLNNASNNPNNLLIILNDNDMSIDDNVGALHRYLSELITSAGYNKVRNKIYNFFKDRGLITESMRGRLVRLNNSLKAFISSHQNIFEGLNIRYFGPFDGHDVHRIVQVLNEIKDMQGPRILHLRTVKGKGFPEAEKNPSKWHAPGKFDPSTGIKLKNNNANQPPLWQEVFGKTLVELAQNDDRVMGITAGMLSGTSVIEMMRKFPSRTFDVGISEGHAVTFAGGLATAGKRPFVAIYSAFLQRAYDNIIHDVALANLNVTFCIDRAGIVGEDGETHHGLFDLAYLNCIPNLRIASPSSEMMLRDLMFTSLNSDGPLAIRYPRGKGANPNWKNPMRTIAVGKGKMMQHSQNAKIAILTIGPVLQDALKAAEEAQQDGVNVDIYDMIWLKPIDEELLKDIAENHQAIVTVEDGTVRGGLATTVLKWLDDNNHLIPLKAIGVQDKWVQHGSVAELKHLCGYDADGIKNTIIKLSDELNKNENNLVCN
ncbi:MAG: 1-deoxy-D-xylulose-5-phosphate synthase [Prevotella sp.]|nr:1-deoxy-D-xylulose-5-phosphate synthase [Bacteroides sp.]MCM1365859.1 1-deoxy-D-xylulose-5-phosphate synthase [Prevotella sp.]